MRDPSPRLSEVPAGDEGSWIWDTQRQTPVAVLGFLSGPGAPGLRVWDPGDGQIRRIPASKIAALADAPTAAPHHLTAVASVARINDAIVRDLLLAPLDAPVIPLPHQIGALRRATARNPVRLLLADEVGLGKTIEAGLIIRELKLRGQARRILIVAPTGLVGQWVAELDTHFGESFELLLPSDFAARRRVTRDANLWRHFDQVVTAMDSVKPLASREGWSADQIARHNRDRFESLAGAGWDLIVIDEAHRLAGATEGVARYELGQGLAGASRHLLLLSATPHSGKTESFARLMALLDERAFPAPSAVGRERVRPYVVRTEKRAAVDVEGRPLFVPRTTRSIAVSWREQHREERKLYEAVTDYVREGYGRAISERRFAVGFLLILFQRLVTSSTRAIRVALERRLAALGGAVEVEAAQVTPISDEEGDALDRALVQAASASGSELAEVRALLDLARRAERGGPEAKAQWLLDLIVELEREEVDPQLKLLVFTEFTASQAMLAEFFSARGYGVAILNGALDLEERRRVQGAFAGDLRILISTEAGGEGLNLQFCHIVVNYDLPWNPMRIEQRIGRVDRIGQRRPVRAFNLALDASVEHRVREVLERKLRRILDDLGVDKLGDVLDSGDVEADFERLYVASLLQPGAVEVEVATFAEGLQRRVHDARAGTTLLPTDAAPDTSAARTALDHPLPRWTETLTLSAIRAEGGAIVPRLAGYDLTWADGEHWPAATFRRADLDHDDARLVTLSEPKLQALLGHGWRQVAGQPVARVAVAGLVAGVEGVWSLWQLSGSAGGRTYRRYLPLFLHDCGHLLIPSARRVWDLLSQPTTEVREHGQLDPAQTSTAWHRLEEAAKAEAASLYQELLAEHTSWLVTEREKLAAGFAARREQAGRIGLISVREGRLDRLEMEEQRLQAELDESEQLLCEVTALLLAHIEPLGA